MVSHFGTIVFLESSLIFLILGTWFKEKIIQVPWEYTLDIFIALKKTNKFIIVFQFYANSHNYLLELLFSTTVSLKEDREKYARVWTSMEIKGTVE